MFDSLLKDWVNVMLVGVFDGVECYVLMCFLEVSVVDGFVLVFIVWDVICMVMVIEVFVFFDLNVEIF